MVAAFMRTIINPFTAPACKVSRLKDAWTHLQTVYFPVLSTVNAMSFDEYPFTRRCKKEDQKGGFQISFLWVVSK